MDDSSVDLRRAEYGRLLAAQSKANQKFFHTKPASFLSQVQTPPSNPKVHKSKISYSADGKEVIPYSVWLSVKTALRQARWNAAIGRHDPKLIMALSKFLVPSPLVSASDYIAAAEALDFQGSGIPVPPSGKSGISPQHSKHMRHMLPKNVTSGFSSTAENKLPSAALLIMLRRREALATAIRTAHTMQGKLLGQSSLQSLLQQFSLVNGLTTYLSTLEGVSLTPSTNVDSVVSATPAGQEVIRILRSLAQIIGQVRSLVGRQKSGLLSAAEVIKLSQLRQRLRLFYTTGVTIRGNVVPLSTLHPELSQVVASLGGVRA